MEIEAKNTKVPRKAVVPNQKDNAVPRKVGNPSKKSGLIPTRAEIKIRLKELGVWKEFVDYRQKLQDMGTNNVVSTRDAYHRVGVLDSDGYFVDAEDIDGKPTECSGSVEAPAVKPKKKAGAGSGGVKKLHPVWKIEEERLGEILQGIAERSEGKDATKTARADINWVFNNLAMPANKVALEGAPSCGAVAMLEMAYGVGGQRFWDLYGKLIMSKSQLDEMDKRSDDGSKDEELMARVLAGIKAEIAENAESLKP